MQEEPQGDEIILGLCDRSFMGHEFSGSLSFLPWHHLGVVAVSVGPQMGLGV